MIYKMTKSLQLMITYPNKGYFENTHFKSPFIFLLCWFLPLPVGHLFHVTGPLPEDLGKITN